MSTKEGTSRNPSEFPTLGSADGPPTTKKRKIAMRACDSCRRKKIKCDAPSEAEGGKCTTCIAHNHDCTFVENAKRRGTPKGYIDYLEQRIDRLEDVLKSLLPSFDIGKHVGHRLSQASWLIADREARVPHFGFAESSFNPMSSRSARTSLAQIPEDARDALALSLKDSAVWEAGHSTTVLLARPEDSLVDHFSKLRLGNAPFFGQASSIDLLNHARSVKNWITGRPDTPRNKAPRRWAGKDGPWGRLVSARALSTDRLKFPPQDLLDSLVGLYFRCFHPIFPTLHQPTFESQLGQGLHKTSVSFARQVLLVCAVGSRWSNDPRVCEEPGLPPPSGDRIDWRVAGWRYFVQVVDFPLPFNPTLCLLDLQNTVLYGFFALATKAPLSPWLWAGTGVRCAMHMGAHLQKTYGSDYTLLGEMWKRTFWCLLNLDRLSSVSLGRPPAVNDDDMDVGLPLEVDDDLLYDPQVASNQTSDKPCQVQFFIHWSKLLRIAVNAMKVLYGTDKPKSPLHPAGDSEGHGSNSASELDSALDDWLDKVPDHLRWDPSISSPVMFVQAANLSIHYHHTRILLHRPFLPGIGGEISSRSYSSLAICTNAARSISHILDIYLKRILATEGSPDPLQVICMFPTSIAAVFTAGIMLLIALWRIKTTGGSVDEAALVEDVQKILRYFKYAKRWLFVSSNLSDALTELASAGGFPVNSEENASSSRPSQKRNRSESKEPMPEQGPHTVQASHSSATEPPVNETGSQWSSDQLPNMDFLPFADAASGSLPPDPVTAGSLLTSAAMNMDIGDLLNSALNSSQLFQSGPQASWFDHPNPSTGSSFMFRFPNTPTFPSSQLTPGNIFTTNPSVQQQPSTMDGILGNGSLPAKTEWEDASFRIMTGSALLRSPAGSGQVDESGEEIFDRATKETLEHNRTGPEAVPYHVPSLQPSQHGAAILQADPNPLADVASLDWTSWTNDEWGVLGMGSLTQM